MDPHCICMIPIVIQALIPCKGMTGMLIQQQYQRSFLEGSGQGLCIGLSFRVNHDDLPSLMLYNSFFCGTSTSPGFLIDKNDTRQLRSLPQKRIITHIRPAHRVSLQVGKAYKWIQR